MIYIFEDYLLDPGRRELRHGGRVVAVEPQVFDILHHLIRNRDRVVSSADLKTNVWRGRTVSASTVGSRIAAVRRVVGDSGDRQRMILTLPRRGHRFVASVREDHERSDLPATKRSLGDPPDSILPPQTSHSQAVTFCRTMDGINLAVAVAGEGPALVRTTHWLSHVEYDWLSPVTSKFLHSLADCSQLIRYDGRGVGLSDRDAPKLSLSTFQTDLETVVNSLKLERFALLGTSQGAAIAISYAARHPHRVSKLILHGAYALGRNRRGTREDIDEAKVMIAMMRRGWGDEHSAFMRAFSTLFLPNGSLQQIKAYADLQRVATTPETATKIRVIQDELDIRDILPKVRAPTIVFHSRHDNVVPFEQGRLVAASIPNSRFVPLESDNHVLLSDEPAFAAFIETVREFLHTA